MAGELTYMFGPPTTPMSRPSIFSKYVICGRYGVNPNLYDVCVLMARLNGSYPV